MVGLEESSLSEHHDIVLNHDLVELVKVVEVSLVTCIVLDVLVLIYVADAEEVASSRCEEEHCWTRLVEELESLNLKGVEERVEGFND